MKSLLKFIHDIKRSCCLLRAGCDLPWKTTWKSHNIMLKVRNGISGRYLGEEQQVNFRSVFPVGTYYYDGPMPFETITMRLQSATSRVTSLVPSSGWRTMTAK